MNERIRELARQSGYPMVDSPVWKSQFERFIDTLLTECLTAAQDLRGYSGVGEDGNPYDTESWNAALAAVEELINKRLGTTL